MKKNKDATKETPDTVAPFKIPDQPAQDRSVDELNMTKEQIADLRWRLRSFAEDWDAPEMNVYDAL